MVRLDLDVLVMLVVLVSILLDNSIESSSAVRARASKTSASSTGMRKLPSSLEPIPKTVIVAKLISLSPRDLHHPRACLPCLASKVCLFVRELQIDKLLGILQLPTKVTINDSHLSFYISQI